MNVPRRGVELNEPARRLRVREFGQHLISASNELYLYELLCEEQARALPAPLKRAHQSIRAELRRLEARAEPEHAEPEQAEKEAAV